MSDKGSILGDLSTGTSTGRQSQKTECSERNQTGLRTTHRGLKAGRVHTQNRAVKDSPNTGRVQMQTKANAQKSLPKEVRGYKGNSEKVHVIQFEARQGLARRRGLSRTGNWGNREQVHAIGRQGRVRERQVFQRCEEWAWLVESLVWM